MTPVRCPVAGCAEIFEVRSERLGRNICCPVCGVRMTARPVGVEAQLERQQERVHGVAGSPVERLPLAVLVDNVRSLWNVGSIFRTADACGVKQLVLSGITGCPPRPQISKTALGAEEAVPWYYRADPREALEELVHLGYTAVAVETSPRAIPVDELSWPARVALIIGNEVAGVTPQVLDACPVHVSIPMRGVKDSLNVAVAFGIAAHHATRVLTRADSEARTSAVSRSASS